IDVPHRQHRVDSRRSSNTAVLYPQRSATKPDQLRRGRRDDGHPRTDRGSRHPVSHLQADAALAARRSGVLVPLSIGPRLRHQRRDRMGAERGRHLGDGVCSMSADRRHLLRAAVTRLVSSLAVMWAAVTIVFALCRLSGVPVAQLLPEVVMLEQAALLRETGLLDCTLPLPDLAYRGCLLTLELC